MYDALKDLACFVTALIGFLYGARVCWGLGKKNPFKNQQDHRAVFLLENVPVAALFNFIGFFLLTRFWISNLVTLMVVSLTSAILLTVLVIAVSLPKNAQSNEREEVSVELVDGTVCRMSQEKFEYYLQQKKVSRFKRANGWAVIGQDHVRGETNSVYVGVERRSS